MADDDLQKRLEKLGNQLISDIEAWEQRTRPERVKVLEDLSHTLGDKLGEAIGKLAEHGAKHAARAERRERKREERQRRREERRAQQPSVATGIVFVVAAVLCAALGMLNPQLWWMVFVALGLGLSGAGQLAAAARHRKALPTPQPSAAPPVAAPAPVHEVDELCDRLLADLAAAPDAVRAFVSEPDKTVAGLRSTLKSLDQRRHQLQAEDAKGRLAAAKQLRAELVVRRDAALDAETKRRLDEALQSVSSQEAALGQLAVVTERVEGEYTALLVHLQELRTRVSVARSTQSTGQLEGVRASVQRLNDELGAISEAMDAVRRGDLQPIDALDATAQRPVDRTRVVE